ncbi:hypothetical protein MASR2M15_15210 [Anaerolineales bacterium]
MPLYDYRCQECEHLYEARHGMSEAAPPCPACGSSQVKKAIISSPTIAKGMLANAGDGRRASKEELQDKWREETPKLRKQLSDKLGEDVVKTVPSLNMDI